MSLRIKIGLVFTALLAIAIIMNAIYTRIAPRPDEGTRGRLYAWESDVRKVVLPVYIVRLFS